MSFGKYDSEYSALKALAFACGTTMPDGGWDSSYSIMASMYEHLVGTAPAEGVSLMNMVDDIQTGVESGEITVSYDCMNEINRLNMIIDELENQLDECGGTIIVGDCVLDTALAEVGITQNTQPDYFSRILDGVEYAKKIQSEWNPQDMESMYERFKEDANLVIFPDVDFSKVWDTGNMFYGCTNLEFAPNINLSSCTGTSAMFDHCTSLKYMGDITFKEYDENVWIAASMMFSHSGITKVPKMYNTKSIGSMTSMFQYCTSLTEVDAFDISGLTDPAGFAYMFNGCDNLRRVGDFVLPSFVTTLSSMFANCSKLEKVPNWNTQNVTDFSGCFVSCRNLDITTFNWDTSMGDNFNMMFYDGGDNFLHAPSMNTSKAQNVDNMYGNCWNIQSVPEYDLSSLINPPTLFSWTECPQLTELGGFTGLKIGWDYGLLDKCPNLTVESLMNVLNKLEDVSDNPQNCCIGEVNMAKLTPEQIQVATSKGWNVF